MRTPAVDLEPFFKKYHRMPETDRVALWTFLFEDDEVSFWGTLAQAISTASLYIAVHDLPSESLALVDYSPIPKTVAVGGGEG